VSAVLVKGAASAFVEPIAPTAKLAVPVLVTVTVWFADEPVFTLPKGTDRSVAGATESVTEMAGAGGGVLLVTVKEFVATISSPWFGLEEGFQQFVVIEPEQVVWNGPGIYA
jgi:hypothetical protein